MRSGLKIKSAGVLFQQHVDEAFQRYAGAKYRGVYILIGRDTVWDWPKKKSPAVWLITMPARPENPPIQRVKRLDYSVS